ncbi:DUF3575 domain-containing protein [uncultured Winogradskyella sp.]|uniref:DUF3575 domain-containing protein n=1 Tax=uncultured Winogradskyella sp. TaxID=395353 RepID=UPI0030EC7D54|tara:strand:+ start:2575 stop:3156 length:582 start_codon:yes stop_codon:yes gene_type:complete
MKKSIIAFVMLFSVITMNAQTQPEELPKKSEISTNLLDMVISGTLNVNYERLFDNNQSLLVGVNLFDTYGYYDAGYIDKSTAMTFNASYLLYFSKHKDHSGFFFYPQLRARTGEVTIEDYFYYDFDSNTEVTEKESYDVSGVSAGFGVGHKWMFSNKFTLTLKTDVARNIGNFDTDYLSNVELRFGVNFGYRF